MIDQQKVNELIETIVALEWDMFADTRNIGGVAWCQKDHETFEIMRRSQWRTMNQAVLASYRNDLEAAKLVGRNLVAEKYARMMRYTSPGEYEQIQDAMPALSERQEELAREICDIFMEMDDAARKKYPAISAAGRDSRSDDGGTSVRTYMLGELLTYSENTLQEYLYHIKACLQAGRNLSEETMEQTVLQYGYVSLEDAEEKRKAQS